MSKMSDDIEKALRERQRFIAYLNAFSGFLQAQFVAGPDTIYTRPTSIANANTKKGRTEAGFESVGTAIEVKNLRTGKSIVVEVRYGMENGSYFKGVSGANYEDTLKFMAGRYFLMIHNRQFCIVRGSTLIDKNRVSKCQSAGQGNRLNINIKSFTPSTPFDGKNGMLFKALSLVATLEDLTQ